MRMENARENALLKYVVTLQRAIRGWYHRRQFLKLKACALMIQKQFRKSQALIAYNDMKGWI